MRKNDAKGAEWLKRALLNIFLLVTGTLINAHAAAQGGSLTDSPQAANVRAAKARNAKEGSAKYPLMVHVPGRHYEIGKYEVTQIQWKNVMGDSPSYFSSCGDNCPVEQVNWEDVQKFLTKLNKKTGKEYRLPTEAEWEYACQGGAATKFCGSDDIDVVAWYQLNSGNRPHSVGQKQPNGYGLYDMNGNVWEWVVEQEKNEWGVLRGGSCGDFRQAYSLKVRMRIDRTFRGGYMGLRIARTLP